jgi:hypothetical protein
VVGCGGTVAALLDSWGRTDEVLALVQPYAASGERIAVERLAKLLVRLGRGDEALWPDYCPRSGEVMKRSRSSTRPAVVTSS